MTSILASQPRTWSGLSDHLVKGTSSKVQHFGHSGPECPLKHLVFFRSRCLVSARNRSSGKQWPTISSKLADSIDPGESKDDHEKDEPRVGENGMENLNCAVKRNSNRSLQNTRYYSFGFLGVGILPGIELPSLDLTSSFTNILKFDRLESIQRLVVMDLDPATAKLAIGFLGPFFSAFGFLFIIRIVMSWYPKLPVGKFPYVIAYAPTEPILIPTRKLIPPLGGVDVTPVVWFGLVSFLSEILVGPQGLLVLLSQQV